MENSQKEINWGIIGPGRIAQDFAADMKFSQLAKLKAVASRSITRSRYFAQKFHIPTVYGNYEDMFDDDSIDVLYIAVPHVFHLDLVSRALKAGKAVLCEKPLTINYAQTSELIRIASEQKVYLMEGMWTYFLPAIHRAKKWVEENRIGRVRHVLCDFGWVQPLDDKDRWYNPALAGGALLDMGCYNLSIANLFINEEVIKISATAKKADTGVDKEISMSLMYENAMASLMTSFEHKMGNSALIIGENGHIIIPDFWRTKSSLLYVDNTLMERFNDPRQGNGFEYEIDAVSQDILDARLQSKIVPHTYSQKLAKQMDDILEIAGF